MPDGPDLPPLTRTMLVADLFCGAGGSSTGARRALAARGYRMDLVAVNHWDVAIETHTRNHPEARHYLRDLMTADPIDLVPEGKLGLLMASPTCTHHSRARGGKPSSDQQRMDPWTIIRWCSELRVARLLVENVPEFVEWGPIDPRTRRPIKSRRGEHFNAWVAAIRGIGGRFEWRILNCADRGDPQTRIRFFGMARFDGKPLYWPPPTHSKDGIGDLLGGALKWKSARDHVIDWSIPGKSIFGRKKGLAPKTLDRILAGAVKFRWPDPLPRAIKIELGRQLIATMERAEETISASVPRGREKRAAHDKRVGAAERSLKWCRARAERLGAEFSTCTSAELPLPTCTAKARFGFVMPVTHSGDGSRSRSLDEPPPTVTTANRGELALIVAAFGEREGQAPRVHSVDAPAPSVCAQGRIQLAEGIVIGRDIDVLFRMLDPKRELARASSFSDAETEYEFAGNKTEIARQIGNAVPVNTACALVGALCE